MINSFNFTFPEGLSGVLRETSERWAADGTVDRIWSKDSSFWTDADEAKWLGWLDITGRELDDLEKYRVFAAESSRFKDVVLLGMGGSSLGPEVFATVFNQRRFHVLDSTVPGQIATLESQIDLADTLFIVASKSGTTLEPNCFMQYFFDRVTTAVGAENAGKQFVAITDPGSLLETTAKKLGFRRIFFGDPEIGGRFSVLSVFGLVAASTMDINIEDFLRNAEEMTEACRTRDAYYNPGAMLGLILGLGYLQGRDKLVLVMSPTKKMLGAWLEQLIGESLGKNGLSLMPIDRRSSVDAMIEGDDRLFVYLRSRANFDPTQDLMIDDLRKSGQAVVTIESYDKMNLGQEFFRWEFATAVAGSLMGLNPFDQPDVEAAKVEARKITQEYERTGALPPEAPFFEADGIKLYSDAANIEELKRLATEHSFEGFLKAHFSRIGEADYFAVLAYLEMNFANFVDLEMIRHAIIRNYRRATTIQFGPRFLHSTGQAFKGGANNGVFLQITSNDPVDLPVPGQKYTFGVVKEAQSRGDFQVLLDRGRRALRLHIESDLTPTLSRIQRIARGSD